MAETRSAARSAHVDDFCRRAMPPADAWPVFDLSTLPKLAAREQINCATDLLDLAVDEGHGERAALIFPEGRWSYRQLQEQAGRIARVLVEDLGLAPGNRVLLRSPNNPMLAACWLAVMKAGGVAATSMPLLRARELTHVLSKAQIDIALCDARLVDELQSALVPHPECSLAIFNGGGGEGRSLEALMKEKSPSFTNVETAAGDIAILAFTSGTTGKSKATMHSHRDILAACEGFPRVLQATQDDVFCGSPPLSFTYGLGALLLFPLHARAASLLLEQSAPPQLLEGIVKYRPTVCFTSPTGYRAMLKEFANQKFAAKDVASLRKCVSAGEPLPATTFESWRMATGLKIIDGIGSTELLHMFISSPEPDVRPGATGRVVPGYQAKVVDDSGKEVPRGEIGRLTVRGPTGCRYLSDPERQAEYVKEGWNFTGDTYLQDADGYFWYQARTDDMIISSGYNISGCEVESVLLDHPKVEECAVVGAADEARGQIVKAFVILKDAAQAGEATARELQQFVKAQIAPYKYPRAVEFVRELPRTATGKLQRQRLRTLAANTQATNTQAANMQTIEPEGWPRPQGYANGIAARGRQIFVAGQIGWEPATAKLVARDLAGQAAQALRNVVAVLRAAGAGPEHLVRLTWFVTDRHAYRSARREIGAAYREIIGRHFPAMSVVEVAGLVEEGALVEIEATAVAPD